MNPDIVIAMVEDDAGHARLIERNLHRAGIKNQIVTLPDGASALAFLFGPDGTGLINKGRTLLILLDLNLPDMSGTDILKRIKENEYLRVAPVVMLTTTDDKAEIRRCFELGCNVYITKPVDYQKFANAIQQFGLFVYVMQVPEAI